MVRFFNESSLSVTSPKKMVNLGIEDSCFNSLNKATIDSRRALRPILNSALPMLKVSPKSSDLFASLNLKPLVPINSSGHVVYGTLLIKTFKMRELLLILKPPGSCCTLL